MMVEVAVDRVEAAYRAIHPRLWRALLSFSGDADMASEAEAEAFAQAIRRGDDIDDVGRWVWRSAFLIAGGMLSDRRRSNGDVPDVDADTPASLGEFLGLLGGLSEQQRACITLRYVGRFTPAEIAELLETTPGTVRVQLHRAHSALRTSLGAEGEHDG
jgi:RNA polymerase sigma factor (sigma-70 family)